MIKSAAVPLSIIAGERLTARGPKKEGPADYAVLNDDVTHVERMPGVGDLLCGIPLVASVAKVRSTTIRSSVLFSSTLPASLTFGAR
jgi:hypothetical protein